MLREVEGGRRAEMARQEAHAIRNDNASRGVMPARGERCGCHTVIPLSPSMRLPAGEQPAQRYMRRYYAEEGAHVGRQTKSVECLQ